MLCYICVDILEFWNAPTAHVQLYAVEEASYSSSITQHFITFLSGRVLETQFSWEFLHNTALNIIWIFILLKALK